MAYTVLTNTQLKPGGFMHPGNAATVFTTVILLLAISPDIAWARAPGHEHYEKPEAYNQPAPSGAVAPRLQNVGEHTFQVTTKSERAQLFINQGVNLSYGFNHAEAARAFAEAARLDPDCAMAYWGQALVLGPNINAPMDAEAEPKAYDLIQQAIAIKSKATARERDWVDALATRYTGQAKDRDSANQAYARAMLALATKYPDDFDAATMAAEALMDLRPWSYWTRDGLPYPETGKIIDLLDSVIKRKPSHAGANHYWIHLWEATATPEKAEAAADRLLPLAPAAGHLVHMPGHIYQRVGRYSDVVKVNRMAIEADEDYIAQCRAQGIYPLGYYPHNIHFLWFGATMAGQSQVAIEAARKTGDSIPTETLAQLPFLQGFLVVHDYALVRFGKWNEILALSPPRYDSLFTRAVRHYARGAAYIGKGQLAEAQQELDALQNNVVDPDLPGLPASFSPNNAYDILSIAADVLAGELAAKKGDFDRAIMYLDKAVRLQDAHVYTEPADWHYPVRHSLGAVLLQADRAREAEVVYWQDLKQNRDNGWSLFGLMQALRAQGKEDDATAIEMRFKTAWANADVQLTGSRM